MGLKLSLVRKLKNRAAKELRYYEDEINKRDIERRLPALKKKYEGKYFKYTNGFNSEDRWSVYIFCQKITGLDNCLVTRFETNTIGEYTFRVGNESYLYLLEQEINKTVYDAALNKFLLSVKSLSISN